MLGLSLSFLATAFIYALVGFGGGSTYAALLTFARIDYAVLPILVLVCNIVVVLGGVVHFWRASLLDIRQALPLVLTSVPLAWVGGRIPISQDVFLVLLALALTLSGLLLVLEKDSLQVEAGDTNWRRKWPTVAPFVGGGIGFFAGLVGIGGGIFLSPLMNHFRITEPKRIAATASFFILVNSVAGLTGQLMKHDLQGLALERYLPYLWLPAAVLIGGQLGSRLSVKVLTGIWVKRMTGILVLFVGLRVLWSQWVS